MTDLEAIKKEVENVKNDGVETINVNSLLNYLNSFQIESINRRELLTYRNEWDKKLFDSLLEATKNVLTTLILINGGAAVAMLAYLGNLNTSSEIVLIPKSLGYSLHYFATGVLAGGITSILFYFTQFFYRLEIRNKKWGWLAKIFHVLSVIVAIGSAIYFWCGVNAATSSFNL